MLRPFVFVWRSGALWTIHRCYHCARDDVFLRCGHTGQFCRGCGRLTLIEPPWAHDDEVRG
jgi:hypothetical protein